MHIYLYILCVCVCVFYQNWMLFFKQMVEEDNTSLFLFYTANAKDKWERKFLDNHMNKIWQLK